MGNANFLFVNGFAFLLTLTLAQILLPYLLSWKLDLAGTLALLSD